MTTPETDPTMEALGIQLRHIEVFEVTRAFLVDKTNDQEARILVAKDGAFITPGFFIPVEVRDFVSTVTAVDREIATRIFEQNIHSPDSNPET